MQDRATVGSAEERRLMIVAQSHSTKQNLKCIRLRDRMSLDFRAVESGCIFCAGGGHEGAN